jgi:protein-L-isoaspartate(D-aspartate) O-methyltransferase
MALMVLPKGTVFGVEHIPELVEFSKDNINKEHKELLEDGNVRSTIVSCGLFA